MAEKIEEKGSEQQRAPLLHLNLKNAYLLPGAKKKAKRHDGKHDHSAAKKRKKEGSRNKPNSITLKERNAFNSPQQWATIGQGRDTEQKRGLEF